MPSNADIADAFDQVADLLEFQGANPFRVRAYRNGARAIRDLTESAERIVGDPDRALTDVGGIGKDLAEKVAVLIRDGSLPMLDELLAEIPEGVLAVMRVPGLGPKRAAALYKELGVSDLDSLREACEAQRVRGLAGFGEKTENKILAGLEVAAEADKRTYWAIADEVVQSILAHMRQCDAVERIDAAGSYRRGRETVGDLDILVIAASSREVMERFAALDRIESEIARGETKMSVPLAGGLQVDLRVVPAESFGAALQYFTGSKDHNVVLRTKARQRGLKINEYGVYRGEELVAGATEEDVYAALDLPWFPPELREARHEFEWAAEGKLPELVELADVRGDLHAHTDWSDGVATIEEMAAAAKKRGLEYLAVTDHSKRVTMANGLDGDRLRRQWDEVEKVNARLKGFTLLRGVEVDILERGGLDIEDEVLLEADWVVASVHYGQNQSRDRITRRVIDALAHPAVCAIAHPTGRLLNKRKAYQIDLDAVMEAAREHGKALELNAHPMRLDLDDVASASAKKLGVPIVISTDAHNMNGLGAMRYGVLQARRGGLTAKDVANTRTWAQLKRLLGRK